MIFLIVVILNFHSFLYNKHRLPYVNIASITGATVLIILVGCCITSCLGVKYKLGKGKDDYEALKKKYNVSKMTLSEMIRIAPEVGASTLGWNAKDVKPPNEGASGPNGGKASGYTQVLLGEKKASASNMSLKSNKSVNGIPKNASQQSLRAQKPSEQEQSTSSSTKRNAEFIN